jgi:phosphoesterase RecJ-like protein
MSNVAAAGRTETFAAARSLIEGAQRIVLTTHVQPDGDGIGSEVALARWLRSQGKDVTILNPNPTPRRFRFFEEMAPIEAFESSRAAQLVAGADLLIVVDISVPARLGPIEPVVREHEPSILIVDHHAGASMIPGVDVRDVEAAATGEIVYRMLLAWGAEIDPPMATALYAAIAYDTGGFRYANTRAVTHEIAADLLRRGVDLPTVQRQLFESMSPVRARILAHALSSFELSRGGRVAWLILPRATLQTMGADPEDVDGAAEALRAIEGVDVSIVVREIRESATKVSFRSRGAADVNAFARRFGGGGHRNAAGAYLEEPLDDVVTRIVPAARAAFDPAES